VEVFVSIVAVVIAAGCFIAILMSDLKKGHPTPVPKTKPKQDRDA
jgi:hypothetical protein